jgi:quinolinate synthase
MKINNNNTIVNTENKTGVSENILSMTDMVKEIIKIRKEKNAVILAHYYQEPEIQDIADFVGDSLALSQMAEKTTADIIVFAGVHFMAETAKIISPSKKVLIPDSLAGCSLADSCPADKFEQFIDEHPNHTVVSYVNTSAAVKALSDIICTSSNAVDIVNSLPKDEKIIFAPDRNLGNYINSLTGRNMVVWNGACHVHEDFSLERIIDLKREYPDAKIIAHPECQKPILLIADFIASTAGLLEFTRKDSSSKYIVATESGILHQMTKYNPSKIFIPAPPNDSTCACNDCRFMKMITMKKLYICMKYEKPEILLDNKLIEKAQIPIRRMLEISENIKK